MQPKMWSHFSVSLALASSLSLPLSVLGITLSLPVSVLFTHTPTNWITESPGTGWNQIKRIACEADRYNSRVWYSPQWKDTTLCCSVEPQIIYKVHYGATWPFRNGPKRESLPLASVSREACPNVPHYVQGYRIQDHSLGNNKTLLMMSLI